MSAAQLEDGDDIFLQLAAAADNGEEEDAQISPVARSAGPRLSWAAKAAAAGAAGAVPPGWVPRQAVFLPPGSIPCAPMAPEQLLPSQPAAGGGGGGVTLFGAAAPRCTAAAPGGGGAAAGTFSDVGQGSLVERYSGLKIRNPRVSHSQLRSRLAEASVLRLSQVRQRHRTAGLDGQWVTICIIGERSKPREGASGRAYSIWKVTDLDQTSISLFLFGTAHSDLWSEPEGTLLALLTPKVKADGDFSLSADSPDQVWVLGQSPEFGYCKAKKKNGEPCRMPVNAARCPFCMYHVKSEYNRLKPTGRNEFQTSNLKTAFRPGMQRSLHWTPGQFESAAAKQQRIRSFSATQLEGVAANATARGSAAGARYLSTVANPAAVAAAEAAAQRRLTPAAAIAAAVAKGPTAAALAAAPIPAGRSSGALVLELPRQVAQKQAQKQQQRQQKRGAGGAAGGDAKRRSVGGGAPSGGGDAAGPMVELEEEDEEAPAGDALAGGAGYDAADAARQRAVELLRAAGGATAPDPNGSSRVPAALAAAAAQQAAQQASREAAAAGAAGPEGGGEWRQARQQGARSASGSATARRPPLAQVQPLHAPALPSVVAGGPSAAPPMLSRGPGPSSKTGGGASRAAAAPRAAAAAAAPKPKSALEAAFCGVLREAEASQAAGKGTRYKDLVEDEEFERLDKIMSALEQKDEMAARMEAVTRMDVQAFRCKLCCYTAERRRPACAAHPHAVEKIEATKRWWKCEGCSYRFSTVGLRHPAGRCAKCNQPGTGFQSVSMFRPPKQHALLQQQGGVAGREQLLARGSEQKWVNSW